MNSRKGSTIGLVLVLILCIFVGILLSFSVYYSFDSEKVSEVPQQDVLITHVSKTEDPLYYESMYGRSDVGSRINIKTHSDQDDEDDDDSESIDEGLIAYLNFNEGSDRVRFSDKENDHDGRCSGSECPVSGVPGHKGNALRFDGQDDLVKISNDDQLEFNEFSVSFWFKGFSSEHGQFFVGTWDGSPGKVGWQASLAEGGICDGLSFYVSEDGSSGNDDHRAYRRDCNNFYQDGQWHHFVGTFSPGKEIKMYIDGDSVGTLVGNIGQIDKVFHSDSGIMIGSGFGNLAQDEHYDGAIDELRIYDRVLDKDEVEELGRL